MDKKEEIVIEKQKKKLKIITLIIIVLVVLLLISRNFGTYYDIKLTPNKKTIFSISDLTLNDLSYGDSENKIRDKMGKPMKEKSKKEDIYNYKELYYDGLVLTLKENYNDYMLVKVEVEAKKYKIGRGIKVGDNILDVMNKFKIQNEKSTYIYGNYSTEALNDVEIVDNIYIGVRSSKEVVYINRDSVVDNKSNISRLNISYRYGKVKKITWSYDFK